MLLEHHGTNILLFAFWIQKKIIDGSLNAHLGNVPGYWKRNIWFVSCAFISVAGRDIIMSSPSVLKFRSRAAGPILSALTKYKTTATTVNIVLLLLLSLLSLLSWYSVCLRPLRCFLCWSETLMAGIRLPLRRHQMSLVQVVYFRSQIHRWRCHHHRVIPEKISCSAIAFTPPLITYVAFWFFTGQIRWWQVVSLEGSECSLPSAAQQPLLRHSCNFRSRQ